jgi:hypothetical protein
MFGFVLALVAQGTVAPPPTVQQQQQRQEVLAQNGLGNGPAPPLVPLKPGTSMVLGRVVEAGSTSGVTGAAVTLSGAALGSANAQFTDGTPGGSRRVATDGQGRFMFRDLPVGTYNFTATASGYLEGNYGDTRIVQIRRSLDLIRSVEVGDADKFLTIEIPLWRNGGIGGRVIDEAGEPMVGVPVTILARMTDWGGPVTQVTSVVITDDRGVYHADVVPGDYIAGVLTATTTFPVSAVEGFQQALSEGGAAQTAFLNQVRAAGSLVGRGPGVRIGNLFVSQIDARNTPPVPPMFMLDGRMVLYPTTFHPGTGTAVSAARVSVTSGDEKTGIDIQLRPVPARRVSGRVTGPNGPASGIAVMLVAPDPTVARTSPATLIDTPRAVADANGEFTFIGIAPGTYTLRAFQQPPPDGILWAVDTLVVPTDSDLTDVRVTLRPGARIGGRIVVDGSGPLPTSPTLAQRPIAITARAVPGSVGSLIGAAPTALVRSSEMQFVTGEYVPGAYMMSAPGPLPPGWILKTITLAGQNVVDKAFELPSGGVTDVVVTITDQISTITGIARDSNGQPAPKATVAVFPADKALWRLPGMASRRVQTAAPGRDGRYTFRGLPAGDYIVVASDWPSADFSDGNVLTTLLPSGERVTITGTESRTQDLRVVVKR